MVTWGDYAVTAVQYDEDDSEIVKVERYEVGDKQVSNKTEKWRSEVVADINVDEFEYTTAYKNDEGRWELGEEIHVIEVDGENYLRTDRNSVAEDNLGELPEL